MRCAMANILEIINLTKVYKEAQNEICVLKDVSFSVEQGKFIVFIGPSGSGKTTLLNLIALLDKTTSGGIIFKGQDLTKLEENRAAKTRLLDMGFVFQFDALLPEFTVLENVLISTTSSTMLLGIRATLRYVNRTVAVHYGLRMSILLVMLSVFWKKS